MGSKKSTVTGARVIRLPTEWEWQWAAQAGSEAREYPWGNDWTEGRYCNTVEAGIGRATAVGMYPAGAAACGALDMAGNLFEWCLNDHDKVKRISLDNGKTKVVRGGSFNNNDDFARASYRNLHNPYSRLSNLGFRVVVSSPIPAI